MADTFKRFASNPVDVKKLTDALEVLGASFIRVEVLGTWKDKSGELVFADHGIRVVKLGNVWHRIATTGGECSVRKPDFELNISGNEPRFRVTAIL